MKHIVLTSGGIGSWYTGKKVVAAHGADNCIFLFNDTRSEDGDLYRFLIESTAVLCGRSNAAAVWVDECRKLPKSIEPEFPAAVAAIQAGVAEVLPQLVWLADGRNLWQLFTDERYIANTRVDVCSKTLKREMGDRWLKQNWDPAECVLYFGIDHSERHRFYGKGDKPGIQKRMLPYRVEAPLCEPPYLTKCEMQQEAERDGIDPPRLYDLGFPHNNCNGFCVKSGHAQMLLLLKKQPDVFDYHAREEQTLRETLGKDVAVLRDRSGGQTRPLPMLEFKRQVESGERVVNARDWGRGCQCFTPEEPDADSDAGTDCGVAVVDDARV